MANVDDALARADWASTYRRLTLYAKRRLGRGFGIQEAEDIAADALRQLLDPAYRGWHPHREGLMWHLQSTVNGLVSNRRRTKARSEERLHDFTTRPDIVPQATLPAAPVDLRLVQLHEYAQAQNDVLASAVIESARSGIESPKEVALALGVPAQKVYDARQRLKRYAVALRLEEGGE